MKGLIFAGCMLIIFGQAEIVLAAEGNLPSEELLEDVSLDGIEQYWQGLVNNYGDYLAELNKSSIYELVQGKGGFSFKNMLLSILEYFFQEMIINGKLLSMLILLTLFSVFLQTMHTAFEEGSVSKIAYFIVYAVLLLIALNSFYSGVSYITDTVRTMSSFMIALIPLILGLLASFGNLVAVSFFHPIIIFLINASGLVVSSFILPLLSLAAILLIVSTLNKNHQVTQLASLLTTIGMGTLGLFLTIFLGVMSVQGAASAIQDGIAMKTAKFVAGNFIPIIGRTLTDAADTILSASLLLKNGIGIVGVGIIVLIVLFPALKIAAIAITYKLAAAILQPIADGPVIQSLQTISKYMMYMLACLLAVSFMFFLAITIIVIASNITIMLR